MDAAGAHVRVCVWFAHVCDGRVCVWPRSMRRCPGSPLPLQQMCVLVPRFARARVPASFHYPFSRVASTVRSCVRRFSTEGSSPGPDMLFRRVGSPRSSRIIPPWRVCVCVCVCVCVFSLRLPLCGSRDVDAFAHLVSSPSYVLSRPTQTQQPHTAAPFSASASLSLSVSLSLSLSLSLCLSTTLGR